MNQIIVAIDPGASGGIAANTDPILPADNAMFVHAMPKTERDFITILKLIDGNPRTMDPRIVMYLEHVSGFAGEGQPGSRMFNFGKWFWGPMFAAMVLGWRVELVRPQKWIKFHGLGTKGNMTTTEWKNKIKAAAQRKFPGLRVTLATADALMILDYAMQKEGRGDVQK